MALCRYDQAMRLGVTLLSYIYDYWVSPSLWARAGGYYQVVIDRYIDYKFYFALNGLLIIHSTFVAYVSLYDYQVVRRIHN